MSSLNYKSAVELVDLIRRKELSPVELMEDSIRRTEAVNPALNAFVVLRADEAMAEARDLAESLAGGGEAGPLAGLPIGVKDLEDVQGLVTSYGSLPFKDNVAARDSIQVARLKAAGAIVMGKTNAPEFGFTGFTKNLVYGITRNPWNLERTPGGSSGGSAAAVVAGMVPLATGSDGGGSTRIPASYSGCFGIKTSAGRIPMGPSSRLPMFRISVMGPLTRTVGDAALFLDTVAGHHPSDPDSLPAPGLSYLDCLTRAPSGLKIAYSPDLGYAKVDKDVAERVGKAVGAFEELGHSVELISDRFPNVTKGWSKLMNLDTYALVRQTLEKNRDDMGRSFAASMDPAKSITVHELLEAQEMRADLNKTLWDLFDKYDLLVTPTMPTEAFGAKGPPPSEINGQPIHILEAVAFTFPFNFSGHPAASVRAGFSNNGLPVGLQIVGPRQREDLVLQAAWAYEQVRPWNDNWPEEMG